MAAKKKDCRRRRPSQSSSQSSFISLYLLYNLPSPCTAFPSPSRSIRFGDVSEANGRETALHFRMDLVTRNALAAVVLLAVITPFYERAIVVLLD